MKKKITYAIIIILAIVVAFLWLVATGGFPKITKDINKYGEFKGFSGYSSLLIFPEKEIENTSEYYYYFRDTMFDPTCQIYLKCQFFENEFQQEIERLNAIKVVSSRGEEQPLLENKDDFNYYALVASNGFESCYEYALVDAENLEIIYVFLQGIPEEKIVFDAKYVPMNYNIALSMDETYNMYAFKVPYSDIYEWVIE